MPIGPGRRGMPASPSEPPVTDVHLKAMAYSSWAKASVSIENETPVASVHTQPTPMAMTPGQQRREKARRTAAASRS